ncbi:YdcF family protein [Streptomyces sp. NPDC059037]|uniref:YdcF family protein n=1 Tax=Streptomyces sp. NPDC059037 TaxID=3346710 RepID=UPI0036A555E4
MGYEPRRCSVAIGLGSHDLGVADVTADLYHRGLAPLIVFTGAASRTTREVMPKGEAEHYRERALELGVPADAILVEPRARNTRREHRAVAGLARRARGARWICATGPQAV